MKTGTIETLEENEEAARLSKSRGRARTPGGRSNGSDDGGNNGGDDEGGGGGRENPQRNHMATPNPDMESQKSRVLMWFLLLVVMMTFGGLISAYVVLATNASLEWRPFSLPFQVWISTAIIVVSSAAYELGRRAFEAEKTESAKKWFLATTVLGGMFISSQILTWLALVNRGFYMSGNPYAGFFYILTAVHAVHVLGGICSLGYVVLKTWNRTDRDAMQAKLVADIKAIGWYWHAMGGLWLILVFLLGFWK